MSQEEQIYELRATLNFINFRLGEFYNKGLYNDNPTRKEIFYILKDVQRVLNKTK